MSVLIPCYNDVVLPPGVYPQHPMSSSAGLLSNQRQRVGKGHILLIDQISKGTSENCLANTGGTLGVLKPLRGTWFTIRGYSAPL